MECGSPHAVRQAWLKETALSCCPWKVWNNFTAFIWFPICFLSALSTWLRLEQANKDNRQNAARFIASLLFNWDLHNVWQGRRNEMWCDLIIWFSSSVFQFSHWLHHYLVPRSCSSGSWAFFFLLWPPIFSSAQGIVFFLIPELFIFVCI